MDSNKFKTLLVVALALFGAIYLGISAATAQFATILWVLGVITIIICMILGPRIWLLIPLLSAVAINFRVPGQPSTLLIAQCLVIGFSLLMLLTRRLPFRLNFTELELWGMLLFLFVLQVYLRNPVGLNVLGGGSVGGKAYLLFGFTVISSALLAGLKIPPSELKTALRLTIIGGLINIGTATIGRFVPSVAYYTGSSFVNAGVTDHSDFGQAVDTGAATRNDAFGLFAQNLSLWVSAFKSPLKACFHPFFFVLIIVSLGVATLSGYRSSVIFLVLTYFVGVCYRGGVAQLLISCFVGAFALTALAAINAVAPLPPNIQRSLSFLPGSWEERYELDTEGSTEWRVEIWKEVLLTDRWIENKLLGDGLGFSARELQFQMSAALRLGNAIGVSGFDAHREAVLANGDYHSGPVQTIRIIGYVGLLVLLLFQIRLAVHAHRQIKRCRNTEWFPIALLVGIPLIVNPIFFVFIFGTFASGSNTLLIGAAMIRMLQKNLPLPTYSASHQRAPQHTTHGLAKSPT